MPSAGAAQFAGFFDGLGARLPFVGAHPVAPVRVRPGRRRVLVSQVDFPLTDPVCVWVRSYYSSLVVEADDVPFVCPFDVPQDEAAALCDARPDGWF